LASLGHEGSVQWLVDIAELCKVISRVLQPVLDYALPVKL
jgi:hypothetical protein